LKRSRIYTLYLTPATWLWYQDACAVRSHPH